MGLYIPQEQNDLVLSKVSRNIPRAELRQWTKSPGKAPVEPDATPIVALANPWGLTLGILFSKKEALRFLAGRDDAQYLLVPTEALASYLPKASS